MKLDFINAFNSLHRDAMLEAVHAHVPEIYNFCFLAYEDPSILSFQGLFVSSEEGAQQGDPLGPLMFALALHPILSNLRCEFVAGYLDDVTAGGDLASLETDLVYLRDAAAKIGLLLNDKKCEIISTGTLDCLPDSMQHFRRLTRDRSELLGAPLFEGPCLDRALEVRCDDLARASNRLDLLSAHDALVILRHSLSAPKLLFILRCAPCADHQGLVKFDAILRKSLVRISNVAMDDVTWIQASLPVGDGGLGVRSVALLAPSAFLASAASTSELQASLLPAHLRAFDSHWDGALSIWAERHPSSSVPPVEQHGRQRSWDAACVALGRKILEDHHADPYNRARLLAVQAPHSGDWLHAWPITACGLRLDDEAIRVAIGLRLGVSLCVPHTCPCGTEVDARGNHGLACRRGIGRQTRHAQLNDCIYRALLRAQIPAVKEPTGLLRGDGKRPDGCTSIAWLDGKCLTWDATVPDTLSRSYLESGALEAGSAAERAARLKTAKYTDIARTHLFCPVAVETLGPINKAGIEFLDLLSRRISEKTGDVREKAFLYQRISVIVQRCNAICFSDSFIPPEPESH